MSDPTDGEASREDTHRERSLSWGWVASLAVVVLTAAVLVGAAVRTPGAPDCEAYSAAGLLLTCPWIRQFVATAAGLFVLVGTVVVVLGLFVGVARAVGVARRDHP